MKIAFFLVFVNFPVQNFFRGAGGNGIQRPSGYSVRNSRIPRTGIVDFVKN